MENNERIQKAIQELFQEINQFQDVVFQQSEMDYLLRNMNVKDSLAVACYFKLGFMTNAKNEALALEIVQKIKEFKPVLLY